MIQSRKVLESSALTKSNSSVKCNLDMKVTVSNVKKAGTRKEKAGNILKLCTLILVIIIMIISVYTNVKKLQLQMDKLNYSIIQLARQYDKLNRHINRKCLYKTIHSYDLVNVKSSERELSNLSKQFNRNNDNSKFDTYSNQAISSIWNQSINHQNAMIKINSSTNLDRGMTSLMKSGNNSIVNLDKIRDFPHNLKDLQTSEIQNLATIKDKKTDADVLNSQNESRIKRLRRNIESVKQRQQKKKNRNRNRRQSGPLVVTFIGAMPEQLTGQTVNIGPWKENNRTSNPFDFTKFHLVQNKMAIEVTISGLYMISVQLFYYGNSKKYSYNVLLNSEGMSTTKTLVVCVTAASNSTGEMTCHTSVIAYLQKGDRLSLQQGEKERFINLKEGYSYIQLVMLATTERETT